MTTSSQLAVATQSKEELLQSRLRHDIWATAAACLAIVCGVSMGMLKSGTLFGVATVAHVIMAYAFAMIMDSGNQVEGKLRALRRATAPDYSGDQDLKHEACGGL